MRRCAVTFSPRWGPKVVVPCELANTEEARRTGLNGRRIPHGSGLVLWFDTPTTVRITTRDTIEPLDIVFVDDRGHIAAIARDAQPGATTLRGAPLPVRAVIELPSGFIARTMLQPGDTVQVTRLQPNVT